MEVAQVRVEGQASPQHRRPCVHRLPCRHQSRQHDCGGVRHFNRHVERCSDRCVEFHQRLRWCIVAAPLQAIDQAVQGLEAGRSVHELLIEQQQMAASCTRLGILEDDQAAQVLQLHRIAYEAQVRLLDRIGRDLAADAALYKTSEVSELLTCAPTQHITQTADKHRVADDAGHQHAQQHFTDAHDRRIERSQWFIDDRNSDDRCRIAGQHECIGGEVAV